MEIVCPQEYSEFGEKLPHRGCVGSGCALDSGGERVKAEMTLLA